ncbi:MAG: hypothetical protein EOS63_05155 [Mesorhizobium sp.]|uniref:hypothetical protein n=1 Tax=Mesorhizobium sp. TaxID=1871066 RepID=UPI000FE58702|nr:hypothetical protein [Mesorhizobium sp.]RWE83375.1 MAG: hypothetical protein EOS63_05155 [Mesorhizobium sp.]TIV47196.1 MAG: hypothetical protein E5V96_04360 [Mesorhizobium sp.]TJW64111.1 MAG: hypothetical protein E5V97_08745 [Mesorhizobium sp.]
MTTTSPLISGAGFGAGCVRRHRQHFGQIFPTEEIVLVHGRPAREAVWTRHQIDRFEDRSFAGVVVAYQNGVLGQIQSSGANSTKVRYLEFRNMHANSLRYLKT